MNYAVAPSVAQEFVTMMEAAGGFAADAFAQKAVASPRITTVPIGTSR
ncbi:MAG: hypothetical protein U1U88_000188 [Lawsonella clevelandensis]